MDTPVICISSLELRKTVNIEHFKQHYYYSHETINPSRIVPEGPELDLEAPHQREERFGS